MKNIELCIDCTHCIDIIENDVVCELNKQPQTCDRHARDKWINKDESLKNNKLITHKGRKYTVRLYTITIVSDLIEPNEEEAMKTAKKMINGRNTPTYKTIRCKSEITSENV